MNELKITTDKLETIDELENLIGEAKLKYYGAALSQLIAFKVFVGRVIAKSPQIEKKYGEGYIPTLSRGTGLSEAILSDCRLMYETERLMPMKEKQFIAEFTGKYSSWNDYCNKALGRKSTKQISSGDGECKHCKIHCQ